MVRGINKHEIFLSRDEKAEYLRRLAELKQQTDVEILSFCVMDNHAHLLLFEPEEDACISKLMLRLNCGYANWYNRRHGRIGPLFQDRFRSEIIESEAQLLAVVRYIHQNPMEIGRSVAHWTSYRDFMSGSGIADTDRVLSAFSANREEAREDFSEFVTREKEEYQGFVEPLQLMKTDLQARSLVEEAVGQGRASKLIRLDRVNRDLELKKLKDAGLSIRQISKVTGISIGVIARA